MNYGVLVRVEHCLAHIAKDPQPFRDRARVHRRQYSVSGTPSTYSITNYGVPSADVSAS